MKKFENFCKTLDNLRLVRNLNEPYDVLTLTGSAALFEICFEQAWKAMKEILQEHGYGEGQTGSPKQILKLAYSAGMIQDEKKWLAMLVGCTQSGIGVPLALTFFGVPHMIPGRLRH